MNARRRLLVRDPKKMISPMMINRAIVKKSSCLFWTLFAMACTTAIVSMMYSYDVSNRLLSVVHEESEFLLDITIEESSSSTDNQRNGVEVKGDVKEEEEAPIS